jgi:hypothetical protein
VRKIQGNSKERKEGIKKRAKKLEEMEGNEERKRK